jgi:hypothetical protein
MLVQIRLSRLLSRSLSIYVPGHSAKATFSRDESQELLFAIVRPFSLILKWLSVAMIEEDIVAQGAVQCSRLSQA